MYNMYSIRGVCILWTRTCECVAHILCVSMFVRLSPFPSFNIIFWVRAIFWLSSDRRFFTIFFLFFCFFFFCFLSLLHIFPHEGGVFVVLLCGLALAILVAILEFCWNSKKNAQTDRQSLCSEMAEELRFAIRCHGSRQRPALKRNCIKCSPGTTYVPGMTHHLNDVSRNYHLLYRNPLRSFIYVYSFFVFIYFGYCLAINIHLDAIE